MEAILKVVIIVLIWLGLMWLSQVIINHLFEPAFLTFVFGTPQLPLWKVMILSVVGGALVNHK